MIITDLKPLPLPWYSRLADFYRIVETTGVWPDDLGEARVVMLPKGGSDDPSDRGPIVLLSALYRLWATARARLMAQGE